MRSLRLFFLAFLLLTGSAAIARNPFDEVSISFTVAEYLFSFIMTVDGLLDLTLGGGYAGSLPLSEQTIEFVREQLRLNRVPGWKKRVAIKVGSYHSALGNETLIIPHDPDSGSLFLTPIDKALDEQKIASTEQEKKVAEVSINLLRAWLSASCQHLKNNSTKKYALAKCLIPFISTGGTRLIERFCFSRWLRPFYETYFLNQALKIGRGFFTAYANMQLLNTYKRSQVRKIDESLLADIDVLQAYRAILLGEKMRVSIKVGVQQGDLGTWLFENVPLYHSLMCLYYDPSFPNPDSRIEKIDMRIAQLEADKIKEQAYKAAPAVSSEKTDPDKILAAAYLNNYSH